MMTTTASATIPSNSISGSNDCIALGLLCSGRVEIASLR